LGKKKGKRLGEGRGEVTRRSIEPFAQQDAESKKNSRLAVPDAIAGEAAGTPGDGVKRFIWNQEVLKKIWKENTFIAT